MPGPQRPTKQPSRRTLTRKNEQRHCGTPNMEQHTRMKAPRTSPQIATKTKIGRKPGPNGSSPILTESEILITLHMLNYRFNNRIRQGDTREMVETASKRPDHVHTIPLEVLQFH